MTFRFNNEFFSGEPSCIFELSGAPMYDLRKDSTNGGNGPQRWTDKSTWTFSNNAAVLAYNVARGIYYQGEWMFGGQNLAAHRLPSSSWIAAANECSRLIEIAGLPTEPSFRAGYEINGDIEPIDVIDDFKLACNGRLAEVGGSLKLLVGAMGAAVFSFTDLDVLVTKGQSFDPFPSLDQTYNSLTANYPAPKEKWATKDAPPLYDDALEAEDGDRRLTAGIDFAAVPFPRQVQRLMRPMILEQRRFRVHRISLGPEAWRLEPNDVIAWTSNRNGYVNKKFLIQSIAGSMGMTQSLQIKEIDPSDYDWTGDFERPVSTGWLGRIDAPVQIMQGWTAVADTVLDSSGLARRPAIRVSCAANLDDVKRVWVQARNKITGNVLFDSDQSPYAFPFSWLLSGNWCLPATAYQVRGMLIPFTSRKTAWSAWIDVTTDDIRFSAADLHLLEITQEIKADIVMLEEWIWQDNAIRNLLEKTGKLGKSLAEQDLANFADKQQLRREVTSVTGALKASFTEQITVATSTNAALASQVTTLTAGLAGKADVSVLNAYVAQVSDINDVLTLQGDAIDSIELALDGKASVTALSVLSGTVTAQGSTITAQASQLNSLSAQVGDVSADARFRMEVVNSNGSGYATIGAQVRFGTADSYRSAGWYQTVPSDPGQPTQIIFTADRFAVAAGNNEVGVQVFAVDSGGVYLSSAYIRNIATDKITFLDGSVQTSALEQGAATSLFDAAMINPVTMTSVFQGIVDTDVVKTAADGIVVLADILARATTLVGGKASLQIELRENNVMIKETTLEFTAIGLSQNAAFYHMRTGGAGSYNYKLVVKKSAAGEDFFVGRRTIAPVVYKKAN